ncbi:hypothetical protein [Microbulbifer sp. HZ11]
MDGAVSGVFCSDQCGNRRRQ